MEARTSKLEALRTFWVTELFPSKGREWQRGWPYVFLCLSVMGLIGGVIGLLYGPPLLTVSFLLLLVVGAPICYRLYKQRFFMAPARHGAGDAGRTERP